MVAGPAGPAGPLRPCAVLQMCGFGDKDRRPVDPPPVLQLVCHMPDGSVVDQVHAELPFLVCYCSLWTADETVECQFLVANRADRTMTPAAAAAAADGMIDYRCLHQTLIGTTIAPSMNLVNLAGVEGVFFIFFDLSIRTEGIYKLKFILCDMSAGFEPGVPPMLSQKARVIAQVFSDSFRVYTPSQFAGMMESTELTKSFARQGIKLPIRNTTSRNRRQWLRKAAPYTFTTTAGPGASASLPASTLAVPHIISTAHLPPLPPSTGSAGSTGSASSAGPASAPGIPSAPYPPAALHHRHSHPNIHAHHSQHASSQPHGWSLPPSRGSHGPPSQPGGVHPYNGTSHGDGGDDDDRSTETTITDAGGGGASRRLSWTGS
ncbi:velvet factor-domain-containing protein [Entophlyctis helioformis]|nr:velvet factor-domain-containing protein [Entophlyctis helioformis]